MGATWTWIFLAASVYAHGDSNVLFRSADTISTDYDSYNNGNLGHRPFLEYKSSSEYSPLLQVNIWNETRIDTTAGSHIFLRHDGRDGSPLASPLVLDARDLSAVYMNRSFENVFGTRVQVDSGKPYLTFWEGKKGEGVGNGFGLAYDDSYNLVYNVSAHGIATHADLHEFAFTGHGAALVTGVDKVQADTTNWTGYSGGRVRTYPVLDALFQEIDLRTNEVLFSWRALDHINPMDSFEPRVKNWDIYHMNSIQKTKAGNYLISIRHIHSIMLIDGKTGDIIWTLGGKRNDFVELEPAEGANPLSPLLSMSWQHHARYVPGTDEMEMTFFDNHGKTTAHGQCKTDCSRGLHIAINDTASPPTVRLLREYLHPSQLQAQSQGNVQTLSVGVGEDGSAQLGNVFIGWGRCPTFTEHAPDGETVLDIQFSPWHSNSIPDALDNYRAYKMNWVATPWWDPAIALIDVSESDLDVYVSWNGATEVAGWIVRGLAQGYEDDAAENEGGSEPVGSSDMDAVILARSTRTAFETKLTVVKKGMQKIWAEALDRHGNLLRTTNVWGWDQNGLVYVDEGRKPALLELQASEDEPEAVDSEIIDSDAAGSEVADLKTHDLSVGGWVGLSIGAFVFTVGVALGALCWRRQRKYDRVDNNDLASEAGEDLGVDSSVLGLRDFTIDFGDDDDNSDREENVALIPGAGEKGA